MSDQFITKYRPQNFGEVLGQVDGVKVLRTNLDKRSAAAFALSGPSGVGKTTLARLACAHVGIDARNILEVDAASNTGVADMRMVCDRMQYRAIGESTGRAAIIDEAHRLSANAWDSMLKATEEPRPGCLWFLCTTNLTKIPKTVLTRCTKVPLKLVHEKLIDELVMRVVRAEKLSIDDKAIDVVIAEAGGSPRQALSNLAACQEAESRAEALRLIREVTDVDAALAFCRFVVKPGSWSEAQDLLDKLKDDSAEGVRIQVCNYLAAVTLNAKSDKAVSGMLPLLEAFAQPYNQAEGKAPLLISLLRAMYVIK